MIHGMEHLSYEHRLRAGAVQHGEEKALRGPESGISISKGVLQERMEQTLQQIEQRGMASSSKRKDLGWI